MPVDLTAVDPHVVEKSAEETDGEFVRVETTVHPSIGAESEGAVHSHVRRGLDEGVDPEAFQHVALLSIPTLGFPQAMAARSWITDETE